MRHLMSPLDFSVDELDKLLDLANDIEKYPQKYAHACEGKKLATCFYEPSTRTRLSFEAAMLNLGGSVLGFASVPIPVPHPKVKVFPIPFVLFPAMQISVLCVIQRKVHLLLPPRIPEFPLSMPATAVISIPPRHLTDLLTIRSLKGRLGNLTIGLCGDLKFGRTVHSLISALIRYPGIRFVLISPEELRIPSYIREDVLAANNIPFTEVERLEDAMPDLDVLYMTRVQKERFFNEEDYVRLKNFYILTKAKMDLAKDDMLVLHPLPRVNEISVEVDDDPRAAYFKQAQYGVYVRMALILTLLDIRVD